MAGRPTEYKGEETCARVLEYLDICTDSYDEKGRLTVNLPKAEGLATFLDVTRKTLYEWAEKYPEFSDMLDKVNKAQANVLINKGLSNTYNATIAKLILAKQGYHDKSETDLTSKGEKLKTVLVQFIDAKDNTDTSGIQETI